MNKQELIAYLTDRYAHYNLLYVSALKGLGDELDYYLGAKQAYWVAMEAAKKLDD